jgi:hypothetical protein
MTIYLAREIMYGAEGVANTHEALSSHHSTKGKKRKNASLCVLGFFFLILKKILVCNIFTITGKTQ